MAYYLLRRSWQSVILLILVSFIGFGILHMAPGGPLAQFIPTAGLGQEDLDRITRQMGLDRPFFIQYLEWFRLMVSGDWGHSYRDGVSVLSKIASHIRATLELMLLSTVLAALIGTGIGIWGAIRRYSVMDVLSSVGAMVALSIPTFWFGLMAIYFFSLQLDWFPVGGRSTIGAGSAGDILHHLILPVGVLTLVETAIWAQFMRSAMIETLRQDYIRTAKAKGLPERKVVWSHAVRNALLPMITLVGLQFPILLGGALVIETVFSWPGMGRLFLDSLEYRDYPVVMGILMLSAVMTLLGSLIADILYVFADPRIRID